MNHLLEQIKSFTKHLRAGKVDLFKNQPTKNIKVSELISLITAHKNGKHTQQELLGLVFNHYQLDMDSLLFKLETKGHHNEQILELVVRSNGHTLFAYKRYNEDHSLEDDVIIPESVYNTLTVH